MRYSNLSVKRAGFIAVLPYLLTFLTSTASGWLADALIRSSLSVRSTRRLLQVFAFATSGTLLVITGFVGSKAAATATVSAAVAFSGFTTGGFICNYIDLCPHHVGVFFSIGNTFANVAGILAPIVAGRILGNACSDSTGACAASSKREAWQHVFFVTAGVYAISASVWISPLMKGKPLQVLN